MRFLQQTLLSAACFLSCLSVLSAREFTIVAYNVENLFDLDDIAIYDDYSQELDDPFLRYGREKFLTKLERIAAVLSTLNAGAGPEVILFQELEGDFSPADPEIDPAVFLLAHKDETVESMIREGWKPEYADISSALWLLKTLDDAGLQGYDFVTAPPKSPEEGIAHTNAVFSKFPIVESHAHPLRQARDILEVQLSVEGMPLWVYANHWKSGASNPSREPIRVQNAGVLRQLIEARMEEDPAADIVIGGDLNSHYNHSTLYPDMETGINDVLGSQGNEGALSTNNGPLLYNLWFELEPAMRYSEVWRGNRGTLMHLLVGPGLYDSQGISYIDNSFERLIVPDLNADALNRPLSWNAVGTSGGGASDHFPVLARFETGGFRARGLMSQGEDALDYEMPLEYSADLNLNLPDGSFLSEVSDADLGPYVDKLYRVRANLKQLRPLELELRGVVWDLYVPDKKLYAKLMSMGTEERLKLIVRPGWWKGQRQFVVEGID